LSLIPSPYGRSPVPHLSGHNQFLDPVNNLESPYY